MTIEEYIKLLEIFRDEITSDKEDLDNGIDELQGILEDIENADGLDELKDAIEVLENLIFEPNDLIVPDTKSLVNDFDPSRWIGNFKESVTIQKKVVVTKPPLEDSK